MNYFINNSENIPGYNKGKKKPAFAFRRFRFKSFPDRERPACAETYKHQRLKYTHVLQLQTLY